MITYEECKDIWIRSWRQQNIKSFKVDKSYDHNIRTVCKRLNINRAKYNEKISKYFKRFKEEMGNE